MSASRARTVFADVPGAVAYARAAALFRRHGVAYQGRPKIVGTTPLVSCQGSMALGRSLFIRSDQFRVQLSTGPGGTLHIGDRVFINQGVNIYAARSIVVGNHVLLADLAAVYDTDFHAISPGRPMRVSPVVIEDNVWVGRAAIILPGVTVGRHSVIAAGALVTRSVAPRSVVAGNPARVIDTFECESDYVRV